MTAWKPPPGLLASIENLMKWEACLSPERAPDAYVQFVCGCERCLLALKAAVLVEPRPGDFIGWWRSAADLQWAIDHWFDPFEVIKAGSP